MKRKIMTLAMAVTLSGSLLFTSCIGSFGLFNKVLSWNQSASDNKFVNELVFLALNIIPVYGVSYFVDIVILNSIEFWTGSNPMEAGEIKKIESENGTYTVETLENGYNIQNEEGQSMNFIYDQTTNTWNAEANGESVKLIQIEDENNAIVYLPNGVEQRVELSNNGMLAFRQTVQSSYLALR